MLTKITRLLYYILFLITPLIVFPKTSELFEFNKMIFIYLISGCILFLWILNKIRTRSSILHPALILIPFLFFLISQILSTILSIDMHTSLFGYYGRFNGGLISVMFYLALFYILIDQFAIEFIIRLLKVSLISSILVVLWGLPGKFGHDLSCLLFTFDQGPKESLIDAIGRSFNNNCWTNQFRPSERLFSTLGQPNWLGAYLVVNFFVGLYFYLSSKLNKTRILYFVYLTINFVIVLFTRSDSAIIASLFSFALFSLILILINRRLFVRVGLVLAMIIAALFIFKTGSVRVDKFLTFDFLKTSKQSISNVNISKKLPDKYSVNIVTDSWDIRKIVWKGAVDLGLMYPVFGTGVETFAYSYYFTRPLEHNSTSEWDFLYNKAHNEYLNYFATTGFVGLAAYLLMIGAVAALGLYLILIPPQDSAIKFFGDKSNFMLFILSLLTTYVSILITNFFGFSISVINLFFFLIPAVFVALIIKLHVSKPQHKDSLTLKHKIITHGLQVFSYSLFVFFLGFIIRYYVADIQYSKAEEYYRASDYKEAATLLSQALDLHYEHTYEDKISYALANLSYLASYQKASESAGTLVTLSNYFNLKSLKASPKNVNYWKTRAKDYYIFYQSTLNIKDIQKGIEALKNAQKLAPTDPKIPYSFALYYSLIAEDAKESTAKELYQKLSLESADKSIKMKANFQEAYFLKGQLLKKYGNDEEARRIFEFILLNINPISKEVKDELESL